MDYKIALITPALVIDHYAHRLFNEINKINFNETVFLKIVVGPERNRGLIPEGYIYIVENPGTLGVYDAVNQGIDYARNLGATHVTYINCDDMLYDAFIFNVKKSREYPDDIISGRVQWLEEDGTVSGLIPWWPHNFLFIDLFEANKPPITQQGVIFPIVIYDKLGGFDLSYRLIADSDFWLRAARAGVSFRFIPKLIAGYTMRRGQLSSDRNASKREHVRWAISFSDNCSSRIRRCLAVGLMNILNLRLLLLRAVSRKHIRTATAMSAGGFYNE
jgi:GT2 family glycosyltransferase